MPIMSKIYAQGGDAGGGGMPFPTGGAGGPTGGGPSVSDFDVD